MRLFSNNGQLFAPDAANPTFLIGSFNLSALTPSTDPPTTAYIVTITPETTAATPEPASLTLLITGALGIISVAAKRKKARQVFN